MKYNITCIIILSAVLVCIDIKKYENNYNILQLKSEPH